MTQATAAIYAGGFILLAPSATMWDPAMSPRWLLGFCAAGALLKSIYTVVRGARLTRTEATTMVIGTMVTTGLVTWLTAFDLAALAMGATLPMMAVYVVWFLPRAVARTVLYAGCAWWFIAIFHRGDMTLVALGLSIVVQVVIGAEVFSRIRAASERWSYVDVLTGAANRRGITEECERHLARLHDRGPTFAVIALDLDGLREVNNHHGHRAGDALLVEACEHWRRVLGPDDVLGRVGGDEFVIVLPATGPIEASAVEQRLREGASVSWSAGVAGARVDDTLAALLDRADERMYRQKAERRTGADGQSAAAAAAAAASGVGALPPKRAGTQALPSG